MREIFPTKLKPTDFVQINVCGHTYQILKRTLAKYPNTLLGNEEKRQQYYVEFLRAYYFDDNRELFEAVLYYYQSDGLLVRPVNIPMDLFVQGERFITKEFDCYSTYAFSFM